MWETKSYYLTNIAAVSDNHQFGVYFDGGRSTAYAIFREGGAWDNPFPDLRIAFHTGIKMGAAAGYNGMRFYNDYDMSTQVMSINNTSDGLGGNHVFVNNALQAGGSLRAPIFYDSNDTNYYTDPNGTSVLYKAELINLRCGFDRSWDNYPGIAVRNTTDQGPQGDFRIHGLGGSSGGDFAVRLLVDGPITSLQSLNAGSAMYAPIFYDSNDTGYFANPNGDSYFAAVFANNWFRPQGNTGVYFQSYDKGLYSPEAGSNSYGNVTTYGAGRNGWYGWGIGSRHVFMSTTGDNVGVHDNSRGWIWYWNGSFTSFDFGYTQFAGSARSPIFYDNNDTGYYADLNSTGDSIRAAGNIVAYYSDDKLKTKFGNIDNAVDKVCKLNGFYYEANETAQKLGYKPKREVGVSAQEVQEVLPEVVTGAPIGHGYLTVDYERIVPLLIEAIKELSAEVEMLKAR
jgi:hypothetical protein